MEDQKHDSHFLFEKITNDIFEKGYSIQKNGVSPELAQTLLKQFQKISRRDFKNAGIGRAQEHALNNSIRNDKIFWITGESIAEKKWLEWVSDLQNCLNQRLLLGLFSFESHFAFYGAGAYYQKHLDAFKGQSNRVLSLVLYLNPDWQQQDAGELVLFIEDDNSIKVVPDFATLVVFLSEDFPHEVLTTRRDRYSIAGWFSVNRSRTERVDPAL